MSDELGTSPVVVLYPHPWYVGTVATVTLVLVLAMNRWVDMGSGVPIATAAGVAISLRYTFRLAVHRSGVTIQGVEARWDQMELSRGPFGHRLRVPRSIEPRRRRRVKLFIPVWEPHWRGGEIGAHIARYAPHLLAQAE